MFLGWLIVIDQAAAHHLLNVFGLLDPLPTTWRRKKEPLFRATGLASLDHKRSGVELPTSGRSDASPAFRKKAVRVRPPRARIVGRRPPAQR